MAPPARSGPGLDPAADAGAATPPDRATDPADGDRTMIAPEGRTLIAPVARHGPEAGEATMVAQRDHAPLAPALVPEGTLINNNYRVEALVSAGGMGEVYRAVNAFTGDPVAVKCILPGLASDTAMIDLFRSEARVLVQLRHDAIVRYHNFVLDPGLGRYCLIMEFVDGPHLGEALRDGRALPDDDALGLLRRLALGLAQVHARGVVHRDLSPDNVILRHGRVAEAVMIDFGIARWAGAGDGLAGRFAGKFRYIAPEQLGHAGGRIGPRTDIYGLALLIAAMVRGQPLDMGDSAISASAARQAIPDLSGVSHRLYPLLQHMLEPAPDARPADMGRVVAMLDDPALLPARYRLPLWRPSGPGAAAAGDDAEAVSASPFVSAPLALPLQPAPAPSPATRRARGPWVAVLAVAVLATAGAGLWWARQPAAPAVPDAAASSVEAKDRPDAPALPPRDPATREGFLAAQALGPCALAQRVAAGPRAGMIDILAERSPDVAPMLDAYQAAFGSRPEVAARQVSQTQCSTIDFVAELAGRRAPAPVIEAAAVPEAGAVAIRGTVTGLAGRNAWVFLTAPDGTVHDLTARAEPAGDGSLRLGLAMGGVLADGPYLLGAVAASQPMATVAAAPSGVPGAALMPALMSELRFDPDAAAAALIALDLPAAGAAQP